MEGCTQIGENHAVILRFQHAGKPYTLRKHPEIERGLKLGTHSEDDAAKTVWYLRAWFNGHRRSIPLPANGAQAIQEATTILEHRSKQNSFTGIPKTKRRKLHKAFEFLWENREDYRDLVIDLARALGAKL